MPPSLDEHFDESLDEDTYKFVLSTVTAVSSRADLVTALAECMARNKADPAVTAELLRTAGWAAAVAALQKGRISVRRGDFAEMLAGEAAEAFNGMVVPVRKLRYQVDPNQTLPGSDVVAFLFDEDGSIDDLEFIESKYRTDPPFNIAVMAHDQLSADRDDGYATTINFIAHRLHELDLDKYRAFMEFLADRNVKDTTNTVVLCFDGDNWDDEIASNLDDVPEHLPDLWLRLFPVEEAIDLIDSVYDELLWQAIDDD
jgi:hypothetical protein